MKTVLKNLLLVFGSIALFFTALELTLALFSPHKLRIRPYHEIYNPIIGWVNKPLKDEGIHFEFARNRFFHVKHNSLGLRGKETSYKKPSNVKRILFVGDSYFWGYGVSNDEVISSILQQSLPNTIEVLNGATVGYGTDQAYLWLKNEGLKYQPDIVLFSFSAANDLQEISTSVSYYTPKPIFMLENGKLTLKNVPVPRTEQTDRKAFGEPRTLFGKLKKFLRFHTHTYQFIAERLNANPEIRLLLLNLGLAEEYTKDIGNVPRLSNPPDEAENIAFRLINESRKITESSGGKFILVFIPDKEEDRSGTVSVEGVAPGTYERNSELRTKLMSFAEREKIDLIDLLAFTREHYKQGVSLYTVEKYDHHWSALGHRLIANKLLQYIKDRRVIAF